MAVRSARQRRLDALDKLEHDGDVWVATAGADGVPHLVPVSLAWDGGNVVLMTPRTSVTVRNLERSSRARLALGDTRDVVLIDASVRVVPLAEVPAELVELFTARTGWDPRREPGEWATLLATPRRILVWRGPAEIEGRTVMRDGTWVGGSDPED